jgi:hypothetical protein
MMFRSFAAGFGGLLLLGMLGLARAADSPVLDNRWRLTLPLQTRQGELKLTFLIAFSEKGDTMLGDLIGIAPDIKAEPTIADVSFKDNILKFTIKIDTETWTFDGRLAADGKKVNGSVLVNGQYLLVEMLPSKLKSLNDSFALRREALETADAPEYFNVLFPVLGQAQAKKLKADEVRSYADKASKLAEPYGSRWQRQVAIRIATALADQEPFTTIALEQARQAERLLTPADEVAAHMQVLETQARVLAKANKPDELKQVETRLSKLEMRDYQEYAKKNPPFKPDVFEGRKAKSDRTVLVELFTGAECPPCVATDLAFDALERTYKPSDVVFLQYHVHVPGPDPLTSKESLARMDGYGDKVPGTPTLFVDGKKDDGGGGGANAAKLKYKTYREQIEEQLEKPARAKLQLAVNRKGDELAIKASVSDLAKPGKNVSLRLALTEEHVRYQGGNGLRYHHSVVRAMPGGPKGFPLNEANTEHSVTLKLDEVRVALNKSLDEFAKEQQVTFDERPMELKNLRVIAFIQDDSTGEVLQAARADAEEKKGE